MTGGNFLFLSTALLLILSQHTFAHSEYLLSESSSTDSGWKGFYSQSTRGKTKEGWVVSAGNAYTVCDTMIKGADNWVRTRHIPLKDANSLQVRIWYAQQRCDTVEDKSNPSCDNSLQLSYLPVNQALSPSAENDKSLYTELGDRFKAAQFVDSLEKSSIDNAVMFEFRISDVQDASGVYLALQDGGSCTAIHSIEVWYYYCPETTQDYAIFGSFTSGERSQRVSGACVHGASAEPKKPPKAICSASGAWEHSAMFRDKCRCEAGFQPSTDNQSCFSCPRGTFKSERANSKCRICPKNSEPELPNGGSTRCVCQRGFYSDDSDWPTSGGCHPPPPAPQNPTSIVNNTIVALSWVDPNLEGFYHGRNIWYRLECPECPRSIIPSKQQLEKISDTQVTLTGLEAFTQYTVFVYTENAITLANPGSALRTPITFTTRDQARVSNLQAESTDKNSITLTWMSSAVFSRGGFLVQARYNDQAQSEQLVPSTVFSMSNMAAGMWTFRVCAHEQPTVCSSRLHLQIDGNPSMLPLELSPRHLVVTASMIMGVLLLMLLVLLLAIWCYRKGGGPSVHQGWPAVPPGKPHSLTLMDISPNYYSSTDFASNMRVPFGQAFVDPSFYDDPEKIIYEFTKEIHVEQIEIPSEKGVEVKEGCFGAVLHLGDEQQQMPVLVRRLDLAQASRQDLRSFALEAAVAAQFNHPNVLMLYGVAYGGSEAMMCVELAQEGSLAALLQGWAADTGCWDRLNPLQFVHLLRGVACGMQYLSDLNYTHKVLTAENIAVSGANVCKIAGFDVRTSLEEEESRGSTRVFSHLLPWAAPEVASCRKYSAASDVFSFGVLVWEVFSRGHNPAPYVHIDQGVKSPQERKIWLPVPEDAPLSMAELMAACWAADRSARPAFSAIRQALETIIRHPHHLHNPTMDVQESCVVTHQQEVGVEQWLAALKLPQYTDRFLAAEIRSTHDLLPLTPDMLSALGITRHAHRKRILNSVHSLNYSHPGGGPATLLN